MAQKKVKKGKKTTNTRNYQKQKQSVVVNIHNHKSKRSGNAPKRTQPQSAPAFIQTLPIQMYSVYDTTTPNRLLPQQPPAPAVIAPTITAPVAAVKAPSMIPIPIKQKPKYTLPPPRPVMKQPVTVLESGESEDDFDKKGINDRYTAPLDYVAQKQNTLFESIKNIGKVFTPKKSDALDIATEDDNDYAVGGGDLAVSESVKPRRRKILRDSETGERLYPKTPTPTAKSTPTSHRLSADEYKEYPERKERYIDTYHCVCGSTMQNIPSTIKNHFKSNRHQLYIINNPNNEKSI